MELIIMRGLPGSGKSTYVQGLTKSKIISCSADDFFNVEGEYKFNPALLGEAHKACFLKALEAMQARHSVVVVDNTNVTLWEVAPYLQLGLALKYSVTVHECKASLSTCLQEGVHGVPENSLTAMRDRWESIPSFWECDVKTKRR